MILLHNVTKYERRRIMRKFVKKIATVVASLTMISAMGITAFGIEPYSFVGNPNLFNESNADSTDVGWVPTSEDQLFTAVDGMAGVYKFESTYVTAADDADVDDAKRAERRQFKILAEGPDMAWSYQMSFGNNDAVWADNMTQFQIEGIKDGAFVVYLKPANGYVCVIQDGKALDMLIRFHSRDEDPSNFVAPTVANIVAEGYAESDTGLKDADYAAFIAECEKAAGSATTEAPTTEAPKAEAPKAEAPKTGDTANTLVIMMTVLSAGLVIKMAGKKVSEN